MALSRAVSHVTKTCVHKLQTVGCGPVTYIHTDHITAHNTVNGLLLLLWRLRRQVSLNCWWVFTRIYHLTRCYCLQKPPSEPYLTDQKQSVKEKHYHLWLHTLLFSNCQAVVITFHDKTNQQLQISMTVLCQQALQNLKAIHKMLHSKIWKCPSAKQCGFSNRQWCNFQNMQQLAMLHSQPGKWSPCNFPRFPQIFQVNVRTVPIRHLTKHIGTQHCLVNKFMLPITFNTRMSPVALHTYITVNVLHWHFMTNVLSTVCFNRTGFETQDIHKTPICSLCSGTH
jgi:hypothetical protein